MHAVSTNQIADILHLNDNIIKCLMIYKNNPKRMAIKRCSSRNAGGGEGVKGGVE